MSPSPPSLSPLLPDTVQFLSRLISFPSTPGTEQEAFLFLEKTFQPLGVDIERVNLSDDLKKDPDYSSPIPDLTYRGRFNLRIRRPGSGKAPPFLLNTHVDVVPPSEDMADPWNASVKEGRLYGRGACDAKGQVAVVYLLFRALHHFNVTLPGDLIAHLVVEEENGGNGTLAMARRGEKAAGCIVLEPTEQRIMTSIRGAIWFRILFEGKAGHSGQAGQTRSALLLARDAMNALEHYHQDLLNRSRGLPLFDPYPNPMPLTFGRLEAGNWPATAPGRARLEGVLGFLPNRTRDQVCEEFKATLEAVPDLAGRFSLSFMYRHDCSVLDPAHPLPTLLLNAAATQGRSTRVDAMTASCDACYYSGFLKIPTVVWGPGSLSVAHSREEHIRPEEIAQAAETLLAFLPRYQEALA